MCVRVSQIWSERRAIHRSKITAQGRRALRVLFPPVSLSVCLRLLYKARRDGLKWEDVLGNYESGRLFLRTRDSLLNASVFVCHVG